MIYVTQFKANPNHVLRDEAARAAEEGRDFVSASGVDQALQVFSGCTSRRATLSSCDESFRLYHLKPATMQSILKSRHPIPVVAAAGVDRVTLRLQALYIAFFDTESDRVKAENPKLKHSQVQQEVILSCMCSCCGLFGL